ncbi:SixA phosphatase family protein [Chitinimonas sp. BJB300]|uniref:SixA phosphatase family protein n=1 Tax=Chitinimonas sp. BJB300 TaxID=1559339 RepID=UPI000C121091|nr:histidine phosphatase family protein [Chitinimonas sp. BJB300]PHV12731.1 histidine phosphatase family protein [Chitinimonas sp. BJB300]TSJ90911.1 histidine phosphatase family protein [Chitinimonas sp. BJB300]
MNLILWRHAEAEDGNDDIARRLTSRGHKQAAKIAAWLQTRLPADTYIIASEAVRARQTAAALYPNHAVDARLNPGTSVADHLAVAGWPSCRGNVVIVGHQPHLGRLAASLLAGFEADWSVKKGGIWWLQCRIRDEAKQTILKTIMTPDQL